MWEHYGMDVAVEAAVRLPGSGRCGVLDLVDGTVGQPVSPVLKLTDMNGVTTSAVIRQIMYREVLVFYIDQ
ncbi:hypothetical protein CL655_01365 [bacterium]|nr:hypothetical protein [bacterium]|tara:strand:+ start:727 stop:939 length:213 start_codon:yes stop_codon:yes gene_type:complete